MVLYLCYHLRCLSCLDCTVRAGPMLAGSAQLPRSKRTLSVSVDVSSDPLDKLGLCPLRGGRTRRFRSRRRDEPFVSSRSPLCFLPINTRRFEKGSPPSFCRCLCFHQIFLLFIPETLTKQREYIDLNTSYKDYIETIYLKGLFKSERKTRKSGNKNIPYYHYKCSDTTLIYFVITRADASLVTPVCYQCLG